MFSISIHIHDILFIAPCDVLLCGEWAVINAEKQTNKPAYRTRQIYKQTNKQKPIKPKGFPKRTNKQTGEKYKGGNQLRKEINLIIYILTISV